MARWLLGACALSIALMLALGGQAAAQEPPVLTITGEAVVGGTLTAVVVPDDPGTQYEWRRCDAARPSCNQDFVVVGTAQSYVVQAADVGSELMVVAIRSGDDLRARRGPIPPPPVITSVTVDGSAIVGRTLTASAAATNATQLTYQWLRCAGDPPACTEIAGATAGSYVVAAADLGHRLAVRVTATGNGSDTETSTLSEPVRQVPAITGVTIEGASLVGSHLTARATATGVPAPEISFQWLRCSPLLPPACDEIDGATGTLYSVRAADAGFRLAVRASAQNSAGADVLRSSLTDVVPEPPSPSPRGFDQTGAPPVPDGAPQGDVLGVPVGALRYLRPFPVVRVKGALARGGARVTLLRVTAPRGSKVAVRCKHRRCPLRRGTFRVGRIRALERFLPAGARVTIRVSKPRRIGKFVRLVIRNGKAPARRDACMLPGTTAPAPCPAL